MSASPQLKLFTPEGDYVAACKRGEDAACLVAFLGDGATIRLGHSPRAILWHEGKESQGAEESYDFVAMTIERRSTDLWNVATRRRTVGEM